MDPLDELPKKTRTELTEAIKATWSTDDEGATAILRASEPLWNALEHAGGVDSWGGGEFSWVFVKMLERVRELTDM